VGTAILVAAGVSVGILDFDQGSPAVHYLPSAPWRRLITGFLFGTTGALIALSPLGRESGAHMNPVVTMSLSPAFQRKQKNNGVFLFFRE
jgi:aquaporin Z